MMWKGRIRHTVWLSLNDTMKYNEIAKKANTAPNVIQAKILSKVLEQVCEGCQMPKLLCSCRYYTCEWCKKQFSSGFDERFCSLDCAKAWWNEV